MARLWKRAAAEDGELRSDGRRDGELRDNGRPDGELPDGELRSDELRSDEPTDGRHPEGGPPDDTPQHRRRRLVMLDRDGVLNVDRGHVGHSRDFHWTEDAAAAVKWLNQQRFAVVVVTNQAGIAKGIYSEEDFAALMRWVGSELSHSGAHLDAVYYCPHHPTEGRSPYRISCSCRKPAPGMLLEAMADFGVGPADCVMIGDKPADRAAAEAAGVRAVTYAGGSLLELARAATVAWRS